MKLLEILRSALAANPRLHDRARDHVALRGKILSPSGALAIAVRTARYV